MLLLYSILELDFPVLYNPLYVDNKSAIYLWSILIILVVHFLSLISFSASAFIEQKARFRIPMEAKEFIPLF